MRRDPLGKNKPVLKPDHGAMLKNARQNAKFKSKKRPKRDQRPLKNPGILNLNRTISKNSWRGTLREKHEDSRAGKRDSSNQRLWVKGK